MPSIRCTRSGPGLDRRSRSCVPFPFCSCLYLIPLVNWVKDTPSPVAWQDNQRYGAHSPSPDGAYDYESTDSLGPEFVDRPIDILLRKGYVLEAAAERVVMAHGGPVDPHA